MTTVNLQPGETKAISFTFTPQVAKQFTVSVDGLTGHFTATEEPIVDIQVIALNITPEACYVGDIVTINVTVKNFGNIAGSRDIEVNIT